LKGSKAREAAECHELLIRLCPSCHRAIHGSRDMRIWAMRYKRGRYDMDAALERVNAHLKRDITWASLGFT